MSEPNDANAERREDMKSAGGAFLPNGDLWVSYHRPRHGVILVEVWGFREGIKVLVDSWCEKRCPECGCPSERYHASICRMKLTL